MIQRYGQEYDDADPMLGDYADLAQKGLSLFKKFGKGAQKIVKKVAARVRARRAKRKGKGKVKPVVASVRTAAVRSVPSPVSTYQPTARPGESMVIEHPQAGLPRWVIPAGVAAAVYFFFLRRGE